MVVLLVALLALCSFAPVAADSEPSTWTEVRSDHFRVLGHEAEDRVVEIAVAAERLVQALDRFASGPVSAIREPITLFAFGSNESLWLLTGAGQSAGFLVPHPHGVFAAFVTGDEPTRQVHRQVVLYLMSVRFPAMPEWFRQGVAEIYSTAEIVEGELLLGMPIQMHLNYLKSPANRLSAAAIIEPPDDWIGAIPGYNLRAWALLHYLSFGNRELLPRLEDFLLRISRLERPLRAFEAAFGMSADELGERVDAYLRRGSLPYVRIEIGELPEVRTTRRLLSRSEAVLAFANLSLHTRPEPDARTVETLRELAASDSTTAPLWTLLGEAERALGNRDAANRALRRAAEIDPASFKAQLLLGETLLDDIRAAGRDADLETIEESIAVLERAARLRPESLAAGDGLSFAYAFHPQPDDRAVAAAESSLERQPGRTDLIFNLLLIRAKRGETEQVREQLTRLAALGADPGRVVSGREMLLQLMLKETRELMRADRLDDAIGVLSEVQARTTSEQLRATALDWMNRIETVQQHNLFVERYNRAVRAYNAGDWESATRELDGLRAIARPGEQTETMRRLRAEVDYWRD